MAMGGSNALYIVQLILSYLNIIVSIVFPIVGIYFLLGPGRQLAKSLTAYFNAKRNLEVSVCSEETVEESASEEEVPSEE